MRTALSSVLRQTVSDLELIVVDDCSTDGTAETLAGLDDPRLRVLRNDEQLGLAGSLNRALDEARRPLRRTHGRRRRGVPGLARAQPARSSTRARGSGSSGRASSTSTTDGAPRDAAPPRRGAGRVALARALQRSRVPQHRRAERDVARGARAPLRRVVRGVRGLRALDARPRRRGGRLRRGARSSFTVSTRSRRRSTARRASAVARRRDLARQIAAVAPELAERSARPRAPGLARRRRRAQPTSTKRRRRSSSSSARFEDEHPSFADELEPVRASAARALARLARHARGGGRVRVLGQALRLDPLLCRRTSRLVARGGDRS